MRIRYGILVDPISWFKVFALDTRGWPIVLLWLSLNFFVLVPLGVEKVNGEGKKKTRRKNCMCMCVCYLRLLVINSFAFSSKIQSSPSVA